MIDHYDLSTVRFVVHSASPVAPAVKREIMEIFPGALWEMYGGTEGTFTIIGPDEWLRKPGSVGRTTPGRDISILDPDGNPLPAGEVGAIFRHEPDPALRFEYAGAPEATARAWRGEFFTLGEMGYLDDDGYLYLTDREKDMIVRGGENVSSTEVEAVLIDHPLVRDVAVIGIPDDEYGEAVLAVVEANGPSRRGRAARVLPRAPVAREVPDEDRLRRRAASRTDGKVAEAVLARRLLEGR